MNEKKSVVVVLSDWFFCVEIKCLFCTESVRIIFIFPLD